MYNILEAKIEFKNNLLDRITVLVEISKHDVRAIWASPTPRSGYMYIPPSSQLNFELLQEIAAYGSETVDRDKIFPGWKKKYSQK